jgi:hypothetical protein
MSDETPPIEDVVDVPAPSTTAAPAAPKGAGKSTRKGSKRKKSSDGDEPELPEPREPAPGRPEIEVTPEENEAADLAVAALSLRTDVYQRGGLLVHVLRDSSPLAGVVRPPNSPRISPLPAPYLRGILAECAWWYVWRIVKKEAVKAQVHPPEWAVKNVHARGHWERVRALENVVETPFLRPDGSLCERPGYDDATGILYEPTCAFPAIPDQPTRENARAAREFLNEAFYDFPFPTDAHRAAAHAAVLTPLARTAFRGCAPLFLIDANTRGSGKSLLCDVVSEIVAGRPFARMTPTDDDSEMRKRITSLAIAGAPLVLIDNVAGALGTPSLDAALTAEVWRDRVLGASRDVELPLFAVWYATGNNIIVAGDLSRRVVHVRLESALENPETRTGFRYPDLMQSVRENRPLLVMAALTVLRAFCVAGRPKQNISAWGSFEGWSRLVRHALVWAGDADPGDTREALRAESDVASAALADLVAGWEEVSARFGGQCTVAQVLGELARNDAAHGDPHDREPLRFETLRNAFAELCPGPAGKLPSVRQVGNTLRRFRGRVVAGKALTSPREDRNGSAVWTVRAVSPGDETAGSAGSAGSAIPQRSETGFSDDEARRVPGVKHTPQTPQTPHPDCDVEVQP